MKQPALGAALVGGAWREWTRPGGASAMGQGREPVAWPCTARGGQEVQRGSSIPGRGKCVWSGPEGQCATGVQGLSTQHPKDLVLSTSRELSTPRSWYTVFLQIQNSAPPRTSWLLLWQLGTQHFCFAEA